MSIPELIQGIESRNLKADFLLRACADIGVRFDQGSVESALDLIGQFWNMLPRPFEHFNPGYLEVGLFYARILKTLRRFHEAEHIIELCSPEARRDGDKRTLAMLEQARLALLQRKDFVAGTKFNSSVVDAYGALEAELEATPGGPGNHYRYRYPWNANQRSMILYLTDGHALDRPSEDLRTLLGAYSTKLYESSDAVSARNQSWRIANAIARARVEATIGDPGIAEAFTDKLLEGPLTVWDRQTVQFTKVIALQKIESRKSLGEAIELLRELALEATRLKSTHRAETYRDALRVLQNQARTGIVTR